MELMIMGKTLYSTKFERIQQTQTIMKVINEK